MAANTRRNSTNVNNVPTVTIVDSAEPRNLKLMGSCCFCIPEIVGVFAILSMYFFTGIFGAAASFLTLGYTEDVIAKVVFSVTGTLNTLTAIASALGVSAIRREKTVLMRRLSIAFWVLTALTIILNIIILILDFNSRDANVNECISSFSRDTGIVVDNDKVREDVQKTCEHAVNASLTGEAIRLFVLGSILMYFAYVIFRFARNMKKVGLPSFMAPQAQMNGQNTPTYHVYSGQPPTSNNWVPPPTYTVSVKTHNDYNPDSKN